MKVLLAGLYHETHCFVPDITGPDRFQVLRGDALLGCAGDGSPTDGFLEVARRNRWTVIPTASYAATPSGRVAEGVFETFWSDVEALARPALTEDVDAIFLVLHGAMVTETLDDPEGELLERLRHLPGGRNVPIFGVYDLHASFTERMARLANGLVAYRENPHTDAREAAVCAAELLHRTGSTGQTPRMYHRGTQIVLPPTGTGTADSPMTELERLARDLERRHRALWAVNVVGGFAFADVHDAGVSFSVVTIGHEDEARDALDELSVLALALKERGVTIEPDVDDVLARICPVQDGPVLLVEPSDNIGGGAPGDGTGILRALLRHGATNAAVVISDPESVQALAAVPVGGHAVLAIGGKGSLLDEGPVTLTLELVSRSDGRFTLEDRNSHLAAMQGIHVDMGPCAVVRSSGITILLTSRRTPPFDLGQLRSQGIEPTSLSLIGVKAAVAHRRAYDPIARASHTVQTPGPCTSNLRSLPYRRIRRPVFPLDPLPDRPGR